MRLDGFWLEGWKVVRMPRQRESFNLKPSPTRAVRRVF